MRIEIYKDGLNSSCYKGLNKLIIELGGEQLVNINKNQIGFWRYNMEVTFHDFHRDRILETLSKNGCTVFENKVMIIKNTRFDYMYEDSDPVFHFQS